MALDITFSVSIDSDRETVTLTDSTTYGTGGNPARADVAVYVAVSKVDSEGAETVLTVTSDDSDPTTDSTWSFSYSNGDGHYKVRYVAIPDYSALTTYSIYDAVYSSGVYRSKANSNTGQSVSNTTWFESISDPTSLADNKDSSTESGNINSLIYQRIFTSNGQYWYGNLIADNCACTDCSTEELLNKYVTLSILLNGAITCDERTITTTGEILCRRIQSLYSNC